MLRPEAAVAHVKNFGGIHHDMVFRANAEGQKHDLTPAWYLGLARSGCPFFFGVDVDERGTALRDIQRPDLFESYMRCKGSCESRGSAVEPAPHRVTEASRP